MSRARVFQVRATLAVLVLLATGCRSPPATRAGKCDAQRFTMSGMACCGRGASWYWNGYRCVEGSNTLGKCGCSCEGPDCGKQFAEQTDCMHAYAGCPLR